MKVNWTTMWRSCLLGALLSTTSVAWGQKKIADKMRAMTDPKDVALLIWDSILVKCQRPNTKSPSWFFLNTVTSKTVSLSEFRGDSRTNEIAKRLGETTTEADRANGFEWRGITYLLPGASRSLFSDMRGSAWPEFREGGGLFMIMDKKDGKWVLQMNIIAGNVEPFHIGWVFDPDKVAAEQLTCADSLGGNPKNSFPSGRRF
jgi:hypothetical protein